MKVILNLIGHVMLPNLSWAGVDRHITPLSIVLLSQKISEYFTDDKAKQGKSRVHVEIEVQCKWRRIQAR